MQTVSSENLRCFKSLSPSEYTETVDIPSSLHALMARRAISPLLAIRTLNDILIYGNNSLTKLNWLTIFNINRQYLSTNI